jgi:hypothetical protein
MRPDHESSACKSKPKLYRHYYNPNATHTTLIQKPEKILNEVVFDKHIFRANLTNKPVILLSCLVEFGCESLLPHYYLPHHIKQYSNYHRIAVGWRGRKLFYQDFDEFWEIKDEYMFLRDYCLAFSTSSKNIRNLEISLKNYGDVIPAKLLGNRFHEKSCQKCGNKELPFTPNIQCSKCRSTKFYPSLLENPEFGKREYTALKFDFAKYQDFVSKNVKEKTIAIFARNRTTYGRNLPEKFYIDFISKVRSKKYNVIWLGEKQSTLKCPLPDVFDFTQSEFADDVEACLALVSRCIGTFQAWTASTRFSQILDIPFCLIESTDQISGRGHEGKRLELLTMNMNKSKIIISNYLNSVKNLDEFLNMCIFNFLDFIENKNSTTVVGIL